MHTEAWVSRFTLATQRDDFETLAYTLFSILRNSRALSGRQIFAKKLAWSGTRLAKEYDPVFGEFLDEIRGLGFDETPFYDGWELAVAAIS
jgi:hypothetical protein